MGKKIDALLGKGFKTAKFKRLVELVSSRIAVLEKQHRLRCMQAQSDVVALLKLGHQESALLRVELVITEQNTLDAYSGIENFCNLLEARVMQLENNRECPDELKEAISSLIFAASKCGELQDLQKISGMFTKRSIVSKLSTHRSNTEGKLEMLKEIALANGIDLHREQDQDWSHTVPEEMKQDSKDCHEHCADRLSTEKKQDEKSQEQVMERRKYKNFKAAAQAAYKLAAHAAVAARAAVELSQDLDRDHDDPRKPTSDKHLTHFDDQPSRSGTSIQEDENSEIENGLQKG